MATCPHEDFEVMFNPDTSEPEHVLCAMCHGLWPVGERIKTIETALELLKPGDHAEETCVDSACPIHGTPDTGGSDG